MLPFSSYFIHTSCSLSHIKSFPPHTTPTGYVCLLCSTSIWPPKNVKDSHSCLHSKLKQAIMQTGIEKNVFGNHPVAESHDPPPAFSFRSTEAHKYWWQGRCEKFRR